jgi:hypothetical protein
MEGDRQRYNVEFPVEEEELAKLDEQFKTLQIRPSGLSAVPGANFEENQQKLISLMQDAELEDQGEGTVEEVNESESEELPTCQDCKEGKVTGVGMKYCENCK